MYPVLYPNVSLPMPLCFLTELPMCHTLLHTSVIALSDRLNECASLRLPPPRPFSELCTYVYAFCYQFFDDIAPLPPNFIILCARLERDGNSERVGEREKIW